jgi:hypothetical protein
MMVSTAPQLGTLEGDAVTALTAGAGAAPGAVTAGLAVAAAAGGPIGAAVGLAVFGLSALIGGLFGTSKTGQEKRGATAIVNQAATLWQQNLAAYQAGGHTLAEQQAAEATFTQVWNQMVQALSDPSLADVRDKSISERDRGGIYDAWKDNYDPIANDPQVQGGVQGAMADLGSMLGLNIDSRLLVGGGLLLVGVLL